VGVILVYQKTDKIKKLGFLFWPVADALRSNYSQTPQTILQRLNSSYDKRISVIFNGYLKYTRQAFSSIFTTTIVEQTANA
jgi:hypothetical protein